MAAAATARAVFTVTSPRKGTETVVLLFLRFRQFLFTSTSPRKGTETPNSPQRHEVFLDFTSTSPRKGTETTAPGSGEKLVDPLHPHHPARGRKPQRLAGLSQESRAFTSTSPRKGAETEACRTNPGHDCPFPVTSPRKGTETGNRKGVRFGRTCLD